MFAVPIMAGVGGVTLDHVYKDGLGFEYFLDLNEILAVKIENDRRAQKAAQEK